MRRKMYDDLVGLTASTSEEGGMARFVLGAALLVAGVVLVYYGYYAEATPQEAIMGRHTARSFAYMVIGAAVSVLGVVLLLAGKRKKPSR
jgi:uncharacterized membrane protein YidH (DUF202 family)